MTTEEAKAMQKEAKRQRKKELAARKQRGKNAENPFERARIDLSLAVTATINVLLPVSQYAAVLQLASATAETSERGNRVDVTANGVEIKVTPELRTWRTDKSLHIVTGLGARLGMDLHPLPRITLSVDNETEIWISPNRLRCMALYFVHVMYIMHLTTVVICRWTNAKTPDFWLHLTPLLS